MLKCEITKEKNTAEVEFGGTLDEIAGELLGLVRQVYRGLAGDDPLAAEWLKATIISIMNNPDGDAWTLKEEE